MTIPKDNTQLENARRLRREMTPHERKLWYLFLRKYPVKIYKQRIIGRFIVDFYCASARLVIELDGSQHYEPQGLAYDAERSQFLMSLGLEILRFSNRDIDRDFRNVCEQIDLIIQKRLQAPLALPKGEPRGLHPDIVCLHEKWSASGSIRSIDCFMNTHLKQDAFFHIQVLSRLMGFRTSSANSAFLSNGQSG